MSVIVGRRSRARPRSRVLSIARRLDWLLLGATAGLAALGLTVLGDATRLDVAGDPGYYVRRQTIYFIVGAIGMVAMSAIDPNLWRRLRLPLYVGTLSLVAVVLVLGTTIRGSTRWITLPGFQFQPSELGKLTVILALAAFVADRRDRLGGVRTSLLALGYIAVPAALVFLEPDLGTSLVYGAAGLAALLIAGVPFRHFGGLAAIAIGLAALVFAVLPAAGIPVLKPYQTDRVTSFLHPGRDQSGDGYNQYQSLIAVGSGGVAGRGVAASTQTNGDFLPEHQTDFIFAVLAEQRGFVGAALLLGLYLVLLWRALRAVAVSATYYGSVVAAGIAGWLLFSVFVNVGMTIGIAPITGIPLPFMSFGGSGTITALLAVGVIQAIQLRGRMPVARDLESRRYPSRR
ncbi:MAG TPA: rod shape-determining protein RodA [Gaiellales bacterium]|jgi:rod shape determining protein RodA